MHREVNENMNIIFKKMNFDKSLQYFLKDKNYYKKNDCHMNSYSMFYDRNYEEVEHRKSNFSYVTGLIMFKKGEKKYCVVHSWVEDRGMVIDTTSLANSKLACCTCPSEKLISESKKIINDYISYVPYFVISNADLTIKTQELYIGSNFIHEKFAKGIETYLQSICDSVANDSIFLCSIREKYGYEFKQNNFIIGINS